MTNFDGNDFAIQLIAKGSFVDSEGGDDHSYLIEAFTLRLNHVALNAFILSEMFSTRDCFDTDEEWEAHKAKYQARRAAWKKQILEALGIEPTAEGICITQSQSEVFAVVYIRKIAFENQNVQAISNSNN